MSLKQARQRRRMRQATLAAKVGITQAALSRYEGLQRTPDEPMRVRLAEALRMRYETVWGQHEPS